MHVPYSRIITHVGLSTVLRVSLVDFKLWEGMTITPEAWITWGYAPSCLPIKFFVFSPDMVIVPLGCHGNM